MNSENKKMGAVHTLLYRSIKGALIIPYSTANQNTASTPQFLFVNLKSSVFDMSSEDRELGTCQRQA